MDPHPSACFHSRARRPTDDFSLVPFPGLPRHDDTECWAEGDTPFTGCKSRCLQCKHAARGPRPHRALLTPNRSQEVEKRTQTLLLSYVTSAL